MYFKLYMTSRVETCGSSSIGHDAPRNRRDHALQPSQAVHVQRPEPFPPNRRHALAAEHRARASCRPSRRQQRRKRRLPGAASGARIRTAPHPAPAQARRPRRRNRSSQTGTCTGTGLDHRRRSVTISVKNRPGSARPTDRRRRPQREHRHDHVERVEQRGVAHQRLQHEHRIRHDRVQILCRGLLSPRLSRW